MSDGRPINQATVIKVDALTRIAGFQNGNLVQTDAGGFIRRYTITSTTDLNTVKADGLYNLSGIYFPNRPKGCNTTRAQMLVSTHPVGGTIQVIYEVSIPRTFMRSCSKDDVWSNWYQQTMTVVETTSDSGEV